MKKIILSLVLLFSITDKWGTVEKIIDSETLAIKFKE